MTKNKKQRFALDLMFDVRQVTRALNYHFSDENGSIFQESGLCAGCFHFGDGGTLEVTVTAIGCASNNFSFRINNLTIASIPTSPIPAKHLSPFDRERACVSIEDWGAFKQRTKKELTTISTSAKAPLKIAKSNGQWAISGYLSVTIERRDKEDKMIEEVRLFYFDPEGTTGSGGDISG